MIVRLSARQLREMADHLDAITAFAREGSEGPVDTLIAVDGPALAYLHWWEDGEQYLAEFIDFTPGTSPPLACHRNAAP